MNLFKAPFGHVDTRMLILLADYIYVYVGIIATLHCHCPVVSEILDKNLFVKHILKTLFNIVEARFKNDYWALMSVLYDDGSINRAPGIHKF